MQLLRNKNIFTSLSQKRGFGLWSHVTESPPDPILGLLAEFRNCKSDEKVNLTVGAYRDENGKPWVLPSVRAAVDKFNTSAYDLEYLPINGSKPFINNALAMSYGEDSKCVKDGNLAGIQTLSGCGAIYMGLQFYREWGKSNVVYYSAPTWPIQQTMAEYLGFDARAYPYYDNKTNSIDFNGMMNCLDAAPEGAMVMFHACSHNPTGQDLTPDQWKQVREFVVRKKVIPYFDMAYQGFASGDPVKDASALRAFSDQGIPLFLGTSFAKNMGLYGTRTGTFSILCDGKKEAQAVETQLNKVARNTWSSPPLHGAAIANLILSTPEIKKLWFDDLKTMSSRILEMRGALVKKLAEKGSTHDWSHINNQIGMFAFTGIGKAQCEDIISNHHVYLTKNGRISVAGLNWNNIDYVAEKFHTATKNGRN